MGAKEKFCKCGHKKDSHKDKNKKITVSNHCRKCPCSEYKNRKRPDNADYAFVIFMIGFTIFFAVASYILIAESDPSIHGTEEKLVTFTLGEIHSILALIFLLIGIYFLFCFVIDPILELFQLKKRPAYPVDENG